ncbi:MAG: phenylalanine--tRNA ligase subunit alpha, partial [Campylobacterales bacterium]
MKDIIGELKSIADLASLEELRVKVLGKKGVLTKE